MFKAFSLISILIFCSSSSSATESTTVMIDSGDVQLFTLVFPKENAETMIFLHGGPGVPMDFQPILNLLSKKYQLIIFDQRGTGRSPIKGEDYRMQKYIQDLNSVAEHFKLSSFHLFGHSWGGLYAQIYAEQFSDKILSLFLSSPSSGTGEHWEQTEREVMAFNKSKTTGWQWLMMGVHSLRGMLGSDAAYKTLFKQVINNYHQDFDENFVTNDTMVDRVRAGPINKTRQNIIDLPLLHSPSIYDFPVLIQYGENDIYGESKQHVIDRFPMTNLIVVKNAGHIAWLNNAEEFNIVLTHFYQLNEVRERK